jgi:hypothetical protein
MSRPTVPVRLAALPLAASLVLALAGCGNTDTYAFAPPCPHPAVVADAGDMTRFRPPGHDVTDMVLSGRITGLHGKCERDTGGRTKVTVNVSLDLTRGPASRGRTDTAQYFVAVADGQTILDKAPLVVSVEFPANVDRVQVTSEDVVLSLPTDKNKSAAAFSLLAGFQLSPDQLAYNREHPSR